MYNLDQYSGDRQRSSADARRVGRHRDSLQLSRQVREDQIEVETDIAISKIQDETMATYAGLSSVTSVATGQQSLEQLAPAATGRLALITDFHALAVAGTLQQLQRRLRRL